MLYKKKRCGNCMYMATDEDDQKNNCVEDYFKTKKLKKKYPVVSKDKPACDSWEYYFIDGDNPTSRKGMR